MAIVGIVLAAVAAGIGLGWGRVGRFVPRLDLWDPDEAIA